MSGTLDLAVLVIDGRWSTPPSGRISKYSEPTWRRTYAFCGMFTLLESHWLQLVGRLRPAPTRSAPLRFIRWLYEILPMSSYRPVAVGAPHHRGSTGLCVHRGCTGPRVLLGRRRPSRRISSPVSAR
jgi:hypothetical protein